VRVGGGLGERQDRLGAGVAAREDGGPLVPGPLGEPGGQPRAQLGPVPGVAPVGQVVVGEAEPGQEGLVELGLQGSYGHPLPVGRLVDVVPGHSAVEQVHAPLVAPEALGHQHVRHGEYGRHPVDDGRVDDLPAA
jgi:hypothetical protein